MNKTTPMLILHYESETAIALVSSCLSARGMRVVRSFDLRSACGSYLDNTCPHHGTSPCDCQLVVLLVYGKQGAPASLIVHSHYTQTEFQLVTSPDMRPLPELEEGILDALQVGKGSGVNADVSQNRNSNSPSAEIRDRAPPRCNGNG